MSARCTGSFCPQLTGASRSRQASQSQLPHPPRQYALDPQYRHPGKALPRTAFQGLHELLLPPKVDVHFTGTMPGESFDNELANMDFSVPAEIQNRRAMPLLRDITGEEILAKHLPQQKDVDKILNLLKKTVLHGYKIPLTVKELIAAYPYSLQFADIYKYITKDFTRYKERAQRTFKAEAEDYVVAKGILFRLK